MNREQADLLFRIVTLVLAAGQSATTFIYFYLGTSFVEDRKIPATNSRYAIVLQHIRVISKCSCTAITAGRG